MTDPNGGSVFDNGAYLESKRRLFASLLVQMTTACAISKEYALSCSTFRKQQRIVALMEAILRCDAARLDFDDTEEFVVAVRGGISFMSSLSKEDASRYTELWIRFGTACHVVREECRSRYGLDVPGDVNREPGSFDIEGQSIDEANRHVSTAWIHTRYERYQAAMKVIRERHEREGAVTTNTRSDHPLDHLDPTDKAITAFLGGHPDKRYLTKEIASALKKKQNSIGKNLRKLFVLGHITKKGRQGYQLATPGPVPPAETDGAPPLSSSAR